MDRYVTGAVIRRLRESKKLTQEELAQKLRVSSKAVSKWETGRGFPDISLLEALAQALGLSVIELLSGEDVSNSNPHANILNSRFYVCPVCGNVIRSVGEAVISCCGVNLPPVESEPMDEEHRIQARIVEDEFYVSVDHSMTKEHYISFFAAVSDREIQFIKLYPEGSAEGRVKRSRVRKLFAYCNRHGMFEIDVKNINR